MDFIFIQSPTYKQYTGSKDYEKRRDGSAVDEQKKEVLNGYLPHGGLFLAEDLIRRGMTVAIIQDVKEEIYKKLTKTVTKSTIAIGISTISGNMLHHALDIAKHIREKYPDTPIIWGGSHPTAVRQQTLEHPLVDYIVWGEGENVLPDLLEAIVAKKGFEKLRGIGYKVGNKSFVTAKSEFCGMDRIFDLPYHLLGTPEEVKEKYARKMKIGGDRWFPLITSRGCPFKCKFCHNTSEIYPKRLMRLHTLDHMVHNINKLIDLYDCDAIGFEDELTAASDARLIDICNAINTGVKRSCSYRITTRVDLLLRLKESTLTLMKDTGFVAVLYGIESGSQRVLDYMSKDIKLDQVHKVDELMNKFGFYKAFNFMTSIPTETISEVKESVRLLVKLIDNSRNSPYPCNTMTPYCPLPDTGLYTAAQKLGFKPPQDLGGWTQIDTEDVMGTRKQIRPWLSKEHASYAVMADKKVAETSVHFTGKDRDDKRIDRALDSLRQIAI